MFTVHLTSLLLLVTLEVLAVPQPPLQPHEHPKKERGSAKTGAGLPEIRVEQGNWSWGFPEEPPPNGARSRFYGTAAECSAEGAIHHYYPLPNQGTRLTISTPERGKMSRIRERIARVFPGGRVGLIGAGFGDPSIDLDDRFIDLRTGKVVEALRGRYPTSLQFFSQSPNFATVLYAYHTELINLTDGKQTRYFDRVRDVSPDGTYALVEKSGNFGIVNKDHTSGTLTATRLAALEKMDAVSIKFTNDRKGAVATSQQGDGPVTITTYLLPKWVPLTESRLETEHAGDLSLSADGSLVLSRGGLYEVATGKRVLEVESSAQFCGAAGNVLVRNNEENTFDLSTLGDLLDKGRPSLSKESTEDLLKNLVSTDGLLPARSLAELAKRAVPEKTLQHWRANPAHPERFAEKMKETPLTAASAQRVLDSPIYRIRRAEELRIRALINDASSEQLAALSTELETMERRPGLSYHLRRALSDLAQAVLTRREGLLMARKRVDWLAKSSP